MYVCVRVHIYLYVLRADETLGVPSNIRSRIFCVYICISFKITRRVFKYKCAPVPNHHARKTYEGVEAKLHEFLTLSLN